jgi:predicted phosphodiesterase
VKKLLRRFFTYLADKLSSSPDIKKVHSSLTELYESIIKASAGEKSILNSRTGSIIPFNAVADRFIIFSDQHKGNGDHADDFIGASFNYTKALEYYLKNNFTYINLGDCEELWENKPDPVLNHYKQIMQLEAAFQAAGKYQRVFGNHDLLWFSDDAVKQFLHPLFNTALQVYEGILLQTTIKNQPLEILLTHGHQGDAVSDNNAFTKWFVGRIWVPIQRWLDFNVNTPAKDFHMRDRHNQIMYQWTENKQNTILVTGHTHKPVFESLDHLQRLSKELNKAKKREDESAIDSIKKEIKKKEAEYGKKGDEIPPSAIKPSYYNTGCCCFNDGDITGIEIADGYMRLIRWHTDKENKTTERQVCEEALLENIAAALR